MMIYWSKQFQRSTRSLVVLAICSLLILQTSKLLGQSDPLRLELRGNGVTFYSGTKVWGTYELSSSEIKRPFFANLKTPSGFQVTRNHPPQKRDAQDHDTMHPGIWLGFGDLDGEDFWRNKGEVRSSPIEILSSDGAHIGFAHAKEYFSRANELICREEFKCIIKQNEKGFLLCLRSQFTPAKDEFHFGDQEEMGLGVRVATELTEKAGGSLKDSKGRKGAKRIWSQDATWCDYSGPIEGAQVGVTILCHPGNFRSSWFHARNYGLMVANPFGRNAMKKGPPSQITVEKTRPLVLQFAVWLHDSTTEDEIHTQYADYLSE